ncbi:RlpA-like double-psi beta-barrel-protein domain-containing protein-containing protein [Halteromyces radiatus]|uniref:RlpA-like double-psi beta-barrel-protein domain-containing protein-containing protein n=1 Tax=Halteromyces radiatus TaxID=101107 RepID=UPI00221FE57E|nr:RlpA-like double-psi beta-barrel-protein domain-containing protein-containing protein [Halteromyces radiatus]KAI8098571.1 RlpA-like double-psi beta-barrel-protein domain-containing protein-containing protein [Halteromyces radiatus]
MKFTLFAILSFGSLLIQGAPILNKRTSGSATFYEVGLGSCGKTNSDSEMVAALSADIMSKSKCGKSVNIKSSKGSVTVKVVDTCPGCGATDIDLSPSAFKKLGSLSQGRIPVTWSIN